MFRKVCILVITTVVFSLALIPLIHGQDVVQSDTSGGVEQVKIFNALSQSGSLEETINKWLRVARPKITRVFTTADPTVVIIFHQVEE